MKYLSLFSGIGGFELAIHKVFPHAACVGYCEINSHALQIYQSKFPTHPSLGDVTKVDFKPFKGQIDLVVAGFPCQDFSSLMNHRKVTGTSVLFFELVRCLEECKPRFFIAENVTSMKKVFKDKISKMLGVQPVELNASFCSAQHRRRLFWCNFPVQIPFINSWIVLEDILQPLHEVKHLQISEIYRASLLERLKSKHYFYLEAICHDSNKKSKPLLTHRPFVFDYRFTPFVIRRMTVIECERLQGFPDHWTSVVCATRAFKALGNAVSVPVIEYICMHLQRHVMK